VFLVGFLLPPGGGHPPVAVYTVRILDVPAQPAVRGLELSTRAISELKLEAPSLDVERPTPQEPEAAVPEQAERMLQSMLEGLQAPVRPLPTAPEAAAPAAPPSPEGVLPAPPAPATETPRAPLPGMPALPERPPAAPRAPAAPAAPRPPAVPAAPPQAPAPPAAAPEERSPLEEVRRRVQSLELRVEQPAGPVEAPGASAMSSVVSLRAYQNRVQAAVKERYTFPGTFPPQLTARVRVVLERDGTPRSIEMLTPSGNERFDYAVLLTLRSTKFPPVPDEVAGETITQVFLFSPQ